MDAYGQLHLDQQLCLALQTTSSLVTRLYRRQLEPLGLTHPQYLVLIALWEAVDPVTMGQLGGKVSMETGSLTPLVKRMEASGLVTRRRDQQDERRVWVEATPAGWALRDEIVAIRQKVVQQLPINAEQIASLRALLQDINAALESSSGSEERR